MRFRFIIECKKLAVIKIYRFRVYKRDVWYKIQDKKL